MKIVEQKKTQKIYRMKTGEVNFHLKAPLSWFTSLCFWFILLFAFFFTTLGIDLTRKRNILDLGLQVVAKNYLNRTSKMNQKRGHVNNRLLDFIVF